MSTPNRATFRPTLVPLEERVVPAWWTVSEPDVPAGVPGTGALPESGELMIAPALFPVNGQVTIQATTAEAAVKTALTAYLRLDGGGGQELVQAFSYDQAGPASEGHPFALSMSGDVATLALEEQAGYPGADYDYNDRTWRVRVAQAAGPDGGGGVAPMSAPSPAGAGPVVDSGTWTWTAPKTKETTTVRMTVTQETETNFFWKYDLTNNNVSNWYPTSPGIDGFSVSGLDSTFDASTVYDASTTMNGWVRSPGNVSWSAPDYSGPFLTMGNTASFTFRTPPVPVVAAKGFAAMAPVILDGAPAIPAGSFPMGQAKGPGVPLTAKLESVTFSGDTATGDTYFTVAADHGDPAYEATPHWNDLNWNGSIDLGAAGAGEHQLPVGFVRKSQVYIEAKLKITGGTPTDYAFVQASEPDGYDLPPTVCPINKATGYIEVPKTKLAKVLADKVDYIKGFNFTWKISTWNQPVASDAGQSKNELFVTLAPPQLTEPNLYVTPLWMFCSAAAGSTTEAQAIPKAFKPFEDATRGGGVKTYADPDPRRNDPSVPLYYYLYWKVTSETIEDLFADKVYTIAGVAKKYKDGKCQSFVDLFTHELAIGGIFAKSYARYEVSSNFASPLSILFIKNFAFAEPGTSGVAGFPYVNTLSPPPPSNSNWNTDAYIVVDPTTGAGSYSWGARAEVTDKQGVSGQNTSNPLSIFRNHYFVRVGNIIYDPSYGTVSQQAAGGAGDAWEAACNAWEDQSLDGVGSVLTYVGANNVKYDSIAVKKAVSAARETVIAPG